MENKQLTTTTDRQLSEKDLERKQKLSTLPVISQKMIERKYQSQPFSRMNDRELELSCAGLLFRIAIITGWKMYDDEHDQNILHEQFMLKLKESYSNVNATEIEYAFRNSFVKDWGKSLNLALIDEVMQPYLSQRSEASRLEEQVMIKPKQITDSVEKFSDDEMIEFYSTRFLDKTLFSYQNIMLLPFELYDKMGINLSDEDKDRIKLQATLRMQMLENEDKDFLGGVEREKFFRRLCKKIAIGEKINKP